jgi:hypothetical protein
LCGYLEPLAMHLQEKIAFDYAARKIESGKYDMSLPPYEQDKRAISLLTTFPHSRATARPTYIYSPCQGPAPSQVALHELQFPTCQTYRSQLNVLQGISIGGTGPKDAQDCWPYPISLQTTVWLALPPPQVVLHLGEIWDTSCTPSHGASLPNNARHAPRTQISFYHPGIAEDTTICFYSMQLKLLSQLWQEWPVREGYAVVVIM